MGALLGWLAVSRAGRWLATAAAALAALGVLLWRARAGGAAAQRARSAADEARRSALERHVVKEVENDVEALPSGDVLRELRALRSGKPRP